MRTTQDLNVFASVSVKINIVPVPMSSSYICLTASIQMVSMRPSPDIKKEKEISKDRQWNDLSWHSVFTPSHRGGTHIKILQDCAAILLCFFPHHSPPPFTSSQFVFEVCNIKFLFLTLTSEEIGCQFTLYAWYPHVALFLIVSTAAELMCLYHLNPYL